MFFKLFLKKFKNSRNTKKIKNSYISVPLFRDGKDTIFILYNPNKILSFLNKDGESALSGGMHINPIIFKLILENNLNISKKNILLTAKHAN